MFSTGPEESNVSNWVMFRALSSDNAVNNVITQSSVTFILIYKSTLYKKVGDYTYRVRRL